MTQAKADGGKLTPTKLVWLERASKLSPGDCLRWSAKANGGGSIRRLMNDLVRDGLMSGPPYQITEAGRAALSSSRSDQQ